MAKTIKFNLIVDGKPVRTLEALRENFVVEDVFEALRGGLLLRWLETRGYADEAEKIRVLADVPGDEVQTMRKVIAALDAEADERSLYALQYRAERVRRYLACQKGKAREAALVKAYQENYFKLANALLDHPDYGANAAQIKAAIAEMATHYEWVLDLHHRSLFLSLCRGGYWLSVMCLLMNPTTRRYYLPDTIELEDGKAVRDVDRSLPTTDPEYDEMKFKKEAMEAIWSFVRQRVETVRKGVGEENLRVFAGETAGYWKDLEVKGRQYMVLRMGVLADGRASTELDYIRAAGAHGVEHSTNQANGAFMILDGLDYKSGSSQRSVLYMEV